MNTRTPVDETSTNSTVSTGHLPPANLVQTLVAEAHDRFQAVDEGKVADYIPALAQVPHELFGLCIVGVNGAVYAAEDTEYEFSIQSVSKPFVFALICQAIGKDEAGDRLGVNSTGLPFNSTIAIERINQGTSNPMVAGAIAATSLAPGTTAKHKWQFIQNGLSRFAGRTLTLNDEVYQSEAATNQRNQGIAKLLAAYDRIFFDPIKATVVYTKQCSLNVTAKDLAVMAATLAKCTTSFYRQHRERMPHPNRLPKQCELTPKHGCGRSSFPSFCWRLFPC